VFREFAGFAVIHVLFFGERFLWVELWV